MVYVATGVGFCDGSAKDDIERMYRELFWEVETKLIMHKIAKDYFGFR